MKKQEFMAMSLPYGLKIKQRPFAEVEYYNATTYFYDKFSEEILPILRPLSDLTKEIEHNGEMFVPTIKLGWNTVTLSFSASNIKMAINTLTLQEAQKLIQWHFDIAGLIEKGEAIDVNTLSENPYK